MENQQLIMEAGKTYHVKITDIQDGNKDIGLKHKYFIIGQDKKGQVFKAEYLSPNNIPNMGHGDIVEVEFPIGVYRFVKCWQVSPKLGTPTIDPCEEPGLAGAWKELREVPTSDVNLNQRTNPLAYKPNCATVNVQGLSISFATAYAKDLLCAEMKLWPAGREVTEADIERMIGWSSLINLGICDKLNFDK